MKISINGEIFQGTSVEIVEAMKEQNFNGYDSLDDYIEWIQQSVWRLKKKGIQVTGDTLEEKTQSLLQELSRIEFIMILER